ncbi:ERMES complex subunit [Thoreauomyces humboldtii]|nr:ERMES complex subunit [Thoreauomyces humboldtii]
MSFKLNWPAFSQEFIEKAKTQLYTALNKGDKPTNIVGDINVHQLNMGTKPPDLEILEIGELQEDRFRGIFKMAYTGDAHLELVTRVQANPLHAPRTQMSINASRDEVLAANWPLVVPMRLKISNLVLRGIIVLVVDKHKGVTLVFKNDPLEKVDVNSTFDNIPNIRRFLQLQIETQLRKMFQEDLPALIHNLSLVYFSTINGKNAATPPPHDSGFLDQPSTDEEGDIFGARPELPRCMRERWMGNDSVDDDEDDDAWVHGYTFYRNLSQSCGALDMGLKNLAVPKPFLNNNAICRTHISDRLLLMNYNQYPPPPSSAHLGSSSRRYSQSAGSVGGRSFAPSSLSAPADHTYRPLQKAGMQGLRASYINYRKYTTRPRIPARAQSSVTLHTDYAYDWHTEFHPLPPQEYQAAASTSRSPIPGWSHSHQPIRPERATFELGGDEESDEEEPFDFENPANIFNLNPVPSSATSPQYQQVPSPVTLHPTDNPRAAHLANLMNSNLTLTIHTQSEDIEHLAFRAHPIRFLYRSPDPPSPLQTSPSDDPTTPPPSLRIHTGGHLSSAAVASYDHARPHPCNSNTFVVPSAHAASASRARQSRSPGSEADHFQQRPPLPHQSHSYAAGQGGVKRTNLRTRNIGKLTLPPGVVIPQGLLSPGLDQRMAEMGYSNPQHLQYHPHPQQHHHQHPHQPQSYLHQPPHHAPRYQPQQPHHPSTTHPSSPHRHQSYQQQRSPPQQSYRAPSAGGSSGYRPGSGGSATGGNGRPQSARSTGTRSTVSAGASPSSSSPPGGGSRLTTRHPSTAAAALVGHARGGQQQQQPTTILMDRPPLGRPRDGRRGEDGP